MTSISRFVRSSLHPSANPPARRALNRSTIHFETLALRSLARRNFATERQLPTNFYKTYALSSGRDTPSAVDRRTNLTGQHGNRRSASDHRPPDERQIRLGKTIRTLHDHLPTLLQSPLPQEILSPQITLRLFPSTHPHLPTVSGRLAYVAALWTAPVAWGRIPVIGDVKLVILSERMFKHGGSGSGGGERLIVRWRTCCEKEEGARGKNEAGADDRNLFATIWSRAGQTFQPGKTPDHATKELSTSSTPVRSTRQPQFPVQTQDQDKAFTGLFIFEFDDLGRLHTHTIEHAEEGGNWEETTSRVISVTDWLLGRAWGRRQEEAGLALGYARAGVKESPVDTLRRARD